MSTSGSGDGPDARPGDLIEHPLERLRRWHGEAAAVLPEPDAMALATAAPDGAPSIRVVLLKGVDDRGVRFFTNYESRKGRELDANPRAAAVLYWQPLHRQVRLEGPVERLSAEESDEYFATRDRGSRLGAWASRQGTAIHGRDVLEDAIAAAAERFPGDRIPRPDYWGGYRLTPVAIEFWEGRANRLHDREHFLLEPDGTWKVEHLSP